MPQWHLTPCCMIINESGPVLEGGGGREAAAHNIIFLVHMRAL